MASPEARIQALVLKKAKLGEADLILHLMAQDGAAVHAVAKGARKPKNASSATLDVLNTVEVTIVSGKSLDIAKGSRLIEHHGTLLSDPARFACASVIAEVAEATIQRELPAPKLFDMTRTALAAIAEAPEPTLPLMMAGFAFKLTALMGMRPSFAFCACCSAPLLEQGTCSRFSYADGGAVCLACASSTDTVGVTSDVLALCHVLFRSTFAEIARMGEVGLAWEVASLSKIWLARQTGSRVRSFSAFKSICGCMEGASVI